DDVTRWAVHRDPWVAAERVGRLGEQFKDRCTERRLKVQKTKCQATIHTQKRKIPGVMRWGADSLPLQKQAKLLGVILDSQLRGTAQVTAIVNKCKGRLAWLRAVKGVAWGLSTTHLLTLYRGFIRSIIDYSAVTLGHISGQLLQRLARIETAGLRICLGAFYGTANAALYAEAFEPPVVWRWSGIRTLFDGGRARFGRPFAGGWVTESRGGKAKRLEPAGRVDRVRQLWMRQWFTEEEKEVVGRIPFWEEEELIGEGPGARQRRDGDDGLFQLMADDLPRWWAHGGTSRTERWGV